MGTSSAYSAPAAWSQMKGQVTHLANTGSPSRNEIATVLRAFVDHNGGPKAIAHGHASASVATGKAARQMAGRLAQFVSAAGSKGLDQALTDSGWGDLADRPVGEIMLALLDRIGGESSSIDDVDARMALSRLFEKYLGAAATTDELEELLQSRMNQIDTVLQDFFGFYLYEVFCRVFFERLVERVGERQALSFLEEIDSFIGSALENRAKTVYDLRTVSLGGPKGRQLVSDIMEATLEVFGG